MAIDAAGRRGDLEAVVADGTAAIGYEDIKEPTATRSTARRCGRCSRRSRSSGPLGARRSRSPTGSRTADAPHLLVAAGRAEKEWGELYDKAGGDRSDVWYLPKATHTAALKQYPEEYEQRVAAFLDRNLRAPEPRSQRRRPESNRCKRLCRPLRSHSATAPGSLEGTAARGESGRRPA